MLVGVTPGLGHPRAFVGREVGEGVGGSSPFGHGGCQGALLA